MNRHLDQYMTPEWASQEILEEFYPDLSKRDLVLEPSCGTGSFLKAVPDEIDAVGIELDPQLAEAARENTGRRILCGDFRTIDLPGIEPTLILGNPPYKAKLLNEFLDRAGLILPQDGRCGFLLSTHLLQTPSTVLRWNDQWSIDQRLVPRTLFPGSIRPLVFVLFQKDRRRILSGGFALYRAAAEVSSMRGRIKLMLVEGTKRKKCWRGVVEEALRELGGRAQLRDIYEWVEPRRHTENRWWKEKVRQTLQRYFSPLGNGEWRIAA